MLDRESEVRKRVFDVAVSAVLIPVALPIIGLAWLVSSLDTRANGFFVQPRVGKGGRLFNCVKIRTMRHAGGIASNVTPANDPRITRVGRVLRGLKIDELPQLFHVLVGDMSMVGPRPDVPGFADRLVGDDRKLLTLKPGITGPASLKYRDEEQLLARQVDPERYNREVIFPDKVRINLAYAENWSLMKDIGYIMHTVVPRRGERAR